MGIKERREKAAVTDAIARELIAKEKAKGHAKTARLRAQREAASAAAQKSGKEIKTDQALIPGSVRSREKASITDAIARDVIAAAKRRRGGKTATLNAAREGAEIVPLNPDEKAALDVWIGKHSQLETRPDAIKLIVRNFLTRNGYLRKAGKR
jgi:hypothetical protein